MLATQAPVGLGVTPRRWTRRVACSTTNSTYSRCSSRVSTQKKSMARMPRAWTRRNCRQLGPSRRRAGSMPEATGSIDAEASI